MAEQNKLSDPAPSPAEQRRNPLQWIVLVVLGLATLLLVASSWEGSTEITYSQFLEQLRADNISQVTLRDRQVTGEFRRPLGPPAPEKLDSPLVDPLAMVRFSCTLPPQVGESLLTEMEAKKVAIKSEDLTKYDNLFMLVSMAALVLLFFFAWTMIRRARDQMLGGGILGGFVKSPAKRYDADKRPITFDDVAGLGT